MKAKRFNNLWTMGLILTGTILVLFYIAKIFFPQFIIGVAEIPSVVKFGNYVDNHFWAYQLYNVFVGYFSGYFYFCACCKTYKLNLKCHIVLLLSIFVLRLVSIFLPQNYIHINYLSVILVPLIMNKINKSINQSTFISTSVCFSTDIFAQVMSLLVRDIVSMATKITSVTITILLIDVIIWRILLYLYFNYKNKKEV